MSSAKFLRPLAAAVLIVFSLASAPLLSAAFEAPADRLPETAATLFDATKFASNQFTQEDDETPAVPFLDVPAAFVKAAEDDRLELWVEPGNYAIRVVDKASGYVFGSSFADRETDLPNFNSKFEGIINSAVVIEYYSYSAETGVYTVLEESMFTDAATTAVYAALDHGFSAAIVFGESGIGLTLEVTLEAGDLHLRIENGSIVEDGGFKLRSVRIYPYFGAVYGDSVPGYVLVPDGAGALVRYRPIDAVTDVYQLNYYGTDIGVKTDVADEADLTLPVYGMIHGIRQHGFLGIIEAGASDAVLVVNPARANLKYYYTHPQFVYRAQYAAPTSKAAAAAGAGTQVIQEERNSFDIHLVVRFLDGEDADYVGMANSYRDRLIDTGVLSPMTATAETIPTHVALVGGCRTEGFLFDRTEVLTDYGQARSILEDLTAAVGPLTVVYQGVLAGGFSGSGPGTSAFEGSLGTAAELKRLADDVKAAGGSLSLYADPLLIYDAAPHSVYADVSQRVDQRLLQGTGRTMAVWYAVPLRAMSQLSDHAETWSDKGFADLALGSVGSLLYSDFKDGTFDRAEAEELYRTTLEGLDVPLSLYRPNAYLLGAATRYLAAPEVSRQYQIYTDTVPFLEIALAGTMDLYGGYLNFAADDTLALLRMADYGLDPAYVLTAGSAYLLQDTELGGLYSSSYATWRQRVLDDHAFLDPVLAPAYGSAVASRRVLAPGFVRIAYANGAVVYVNYGATVRTDGGVSVDARSAKAVTPDA